VQRFASPGAKQRIFWASVSDIEAVDLSRKIKTAKTPGGHHRVPESEIDRLIPEKTGARRHRFTARAIPQDQRTQPTHRPGGGHQVQRKFWRK